MGRTSQLLSLLPVLIGVWFVGGLMHRLWPTPVLLITLILGLNAVAVWMLRYQPESLFELSKFPLIHQYIGAICRISGEQYPVGSGQNNSYQGLAIRSKEDCEIAVAEAKSWVRGQPLAIEKYLHQVLDSAILRQNLQSKRDDRPLQAFLVSGPSGVGKRYLARVLGRFIFQDGAEQIWDLSKLGSDPVSALFGTRGAPSQLLNSVARQPFQTVVLENCDQAPEPLQDILTGILQYGSTRDPASGRSISFRNTIVVLSTIQCGQELSDLAKRQLVETEWHLAAVELISAKTGLAAKLLTCVNEFIPFEPVSSITKAEVVALALSRECFRYGVQLEHVAPEILVQEIGELSDTDGFALLEDRIKKLLQRPLLEAAHRHARRMTLRAKPILNSAK